jgi:hypothetical protein
MNGRSEALKTYIEQTKLLVTLASGFVVAPAAAVSFFRPDKQTNVHFSPKLFLAAELLQIFSVVAGYVVLGSIAGSQHNEDFNVYRAATRALSLIQLGLYVAGLTSFVYLIRKSL